MKMGPLYICVGDAFVLKKIRNDHFSKCNLVAGTFLFISNIKDAYSKIVCLKEE